MLPWPAQGPSPLPTAVADFQSPCPVQTYVLSSQLQEQDVLSSKSWKWRLLPAVSVSKCVQEVVNLPSALAETVKTPGDLCQGGNFSGDLVWKLFLPPWTAMVSKISSFHRDSDRKREAKSVSSDQSRIKAEAIFQSWRSHDFVHGWQRFCIKVQTLKRAGQKVLWS